MHTRIVTAVAVVLTAAGVAAVPAQAANRCKPIVTKESGEWVTATVSVQRGAASCKAARHVARKLVSHTAPYVDNGYSYNSSAVVGRWRGQSKTGGWGATNQVTGAYIGGSVSYE